MKVYDYILNVKSTNDNSGRQLILIATSKKEAMNFCKDFKGLKIIAYSKKKREYIHFNNSSDLMNHQKELLEKYLKSKILYIEN